MKKSTIVLIVLATLLSAIGIYFLLYNLACKGGHYTASRGCCCCSSYGSGGTGQGQTSVLGSGRPGTTIIAPGGYTIPTPTDSLIISIAAYSNQPVYFEVTKPDGSTATPTLYIYKKNSSGNWVPNGYITEGIYTINNNASSLREYAFIVKYDGTVNFDALTFYPETDLHGFDASYSKEGVTGTLRVH